MLLDVKRFNHVQVVLVLLFELSLNNSKAITVTSRQHFDAGVLLFELLNVLVKGLVQTLVEVVLSLHEALWVLKLVEGLQSSLEGELLLPVSLRAWQLLHFVLDKLFEKFITLGGGPLTSLYFADSKLFESFLGQANLVSLVKE